MKSLLAKLAPTKAIGLYIGDDVVAISHVAATPLGAIELGRSYENFQPNNLYAVLERVLAPVIGKRKRLRVPVALGLSGLKLFFSTRPIQSTSTDPAPHVLLHESLQSSGVASSDMAVDLVKSKPGRRSLASIVACPKKYLTGLVDTLQHFGVRLHRVEPAPCALLRAGTHHWRGPRGSNVALRIFLGNTQGLAVQAVGDFPFLWRFFDLPRGDEASAILSMCRSLETLGKFCGVESSPSAVLIHGRSELRNVLDFEWLTGEIGTRVQWLDEPGLDNAAIAFGLALGCLNETENAFDLARSFKPRPSLWELVPWGEMAIQTALLVWMGLFLGQRSERLTESYEMAYGENARHAWAASLSPEQLQAEKKELEQRVSAVHKFLESRVAWSSYTRDIATRLPTGAVLTALQGNAELGIGGQKPGATKAKKSLVIRGAAPTRQGGSAPPEIDEFLDSLRGNPLLKRDFPLVELADLKQSASSSRSPATTSFSVVCQPRSKPAKKQAPAAAAKQKGQELDAD